MNAQINVPAELTPLEVLQSFRPHDYTLRDFFASRREAQPEREYVHFEGRSWSWSEVERDAERVAAHLQSLGVGRGDRVVAMGRNSVWHVLALLAAARLGAIFVPINPQFKVEEAGYVVSHCEPAVILADAEAEPVAREAAAGSGGKTQVARLDEGLLEAPAPLAGEAPADPEAPCIIIYTSGTTGFPKGVVHSQRNLITAGEAFIERLHLQRDERMLAILPMFHINAMFYTVAGSMAAGATLLIERCFSASQFWKRVVELRATQVNMIEAVVNILLNRPESEFRPEHGLKRIYGVRDAMVKRFRERFGVPVLVGGYAMSEIPGVLSTPLDRDNRPGSMGVLCRHPDPSRPWAECRIVDDAGNDLPDGETGELLVRTPIVMKEYFRDPEQTAASFHEGGWFATGDLVKRDSDGFYYFVSRKKDIIRRRGENIAGLELDRVIAEHPGVLLAAAIGVPSEYGDEDILVAVKPKDGAQLAESDIIEWCRSRLAEMKVPRYVILLDELPLTPTHKVAKAELKKDASLRERAVDFG